MGTDFEFPGTERFEVLSRLGAGGMGVVYEVFDRETSTRAALKTLRTTNAESLLRFKEEFRTLQNVQHPNLVHLGELIVESGNWFFTMELVDGVDFVSYVRRGSVLERDAHWFDPAEAEELVRSGGRGGGQRKTGEWRLMRRTAFDADRIRSSLPQLVRGVSALHGANKVHRDIKPSNIMVGRDGRLVLLDFGFVHDTVSHGHTTDGIVVGTADYMAPEQAAGRTVSSAADWYAVGVVMYRSLTGKLPYTGSRIEVLTQKQQFPPTPPIEVDPQVPEDLNRICIELMQIDKRRRATGKEVLELLGASEEAPELRLTSTEGETPFVGRYRELAALCDAFFDMLRGRSNIVYITGESGVGKSALVQRFLETVVADEVRSVTLSGRCHERESVPYKAMDGIVDALSRLMRQLDEAEAASLLPLNVALLANIFPTMRRVECVAKAPPVAGDSVDPLELRRRVFTAMRELLTRLASRRPLVLYVEDLQWADADSLAMIREVMQEPEAPPLLLLASVRTASGASAGQAWPEVPRLELGDAARHVHLEGLSTAEARELTQKLLEQTRLPVNPASARAIADEAGGHPLFIDELVRHAQVAGASSKLPLLEDALWERIRRLDDSARQILEVVAVAGAPLAQETAASAANLDYGAYAETVSRMRDARLMRTSGNRRDDEIEPYHGRVSDAVLAHMEADRLRNCHHRLALALEASGDQQLEALAVHWHGVGDLERAGGYAAEAAAQALDSLAFDRAARLYRLAIEWRPVAGAFGRRIQTRLGDALANAGRGAEAADAYLVAAEGSSAAAKLELERLAADQLLRSGRIDEGLEALRTVLGAVGLELARSEAGARRSARWGRLKLKVRGVQFKERDASQVSLEELTHIDICWSASVGLAGVDFLRGAAFQTRHLRLALAAGEPYRVCRALSMDVHYGSLEGRKTTKETRSTLATARELAERIGKAHARGLVDLVSGVAAFNEGRWASAFEACESAEATLRDECVNVWSERNSAQLYSLWALAMRGQLGELNRRVPRRLREADERGDRYATTNLRTGLLNLVWLAADDVEGARSQAEDAVAEWSTEGFHWQHFYDLYAQVQIDLYSGSSKTAAERLQSRWLQLEKSGLLRVETVCALMHELRGRVELAQARANGGSPGGEVQRAARRLRRIGAYAEPLASLLEAGAASIEGSREVAAARLRAAISGFEEHDMALWAHAARRRLGSVAGGEDGAFLVGEADDWMDGNRILDPERITAMLAP